MIYKTKMAVSEIKAAVLEKMEEILSRRFTPPTDDKEILPTQEKEKNEAEDK